MSHHANDVYAEQQRELEEERNAMKLEHIFQKATDGMTVISPSIPDQILRAVKNPFEDRVDWLRYYKSDVISPQVASFNAKDFRRDDYVVQP